MAKLFIDVLRTGLADCAENYPYCSAYFRKKKKTSRA